MRDVTAYRGMIAECHPVWKDLVFGRIYTNQPLDVVIETTKPIGLERYGRFTVVSYHPPMSYTNVWITAKDGRIIQAAAGSCCWDRVFFDGLTQADQEELQVEFRRRFPVPAPEIDPQFVD